MRDRLRNAGIGAHFRWKGWSGDAALRGSDQGEPAQRGSPTKGLYIRGSPARISWNIKCNLLPPLLAEPEIAFHDLPDDEFLPFKQLRIAGQSLAHQGRGAAVIDQ